MYYIFPKGTFVVALRRYQRFYDDPLAVKAGEAVITLGGKETDIEGWSWCRGADGREGWVPDSWLAEKDGGQIALRDYNALELSVVPGDRLELLFSEGGYLFCRNPDGKTGWLPDGIMRLDTLM
ncbi:SH3 domain-containing protein [Martelella sp. HB161492]|uniref:SH3 domain-containing protein n=1 Tax=Martelella sp. HB161492 TaxID=2720726 RepID=UPI0015911D54|nr:SH3 domain-containing protein [Martelella sp. HB161492]